MTLQTRQFNIPIERTVNYIQENSIISQVDMHIVLRIGQKYTTVGNINFRSALKLGVATDT